MSEKDITPIKRRKVLKSTAVAGAVSLGAVSSAVADSDSDDKLSELEARGVLLAEPDVKALSAETDIEVSDEVRTGEALLERLQAERLIPEASLSVFPDFDDADDTDGQIHDLSDENGQEIAFTTSTPRGRLQVTFEEHSAPSAALFPENGDHVIMYTTPDGENYSRIESELEMPSDGLSTSDSCGDCGGCDCVGNWCVDGIRPRTHKQTCMTCANGECITTNTCGC